MNDDLIDRFFHAGAGFWSLCGEVRDRAPALPAHPSVALGFVALACAETFLPPERRFATVTMPFFDDAVRRQVVGALRDQGLIVYLDNGGLDLTDKGKAIAATLRGTGGAQQRRDDWADLPPIAPPATTPAAAAPAEREPEEPEEIPPPPGVPDETEEGAIGEAASVPIAAGRRIDPLDLPPNPPPRRKSIVNREPPGVPRW